MQEGYVYRSDMWEAGYLLFIIHKYLGQLLYSYWWRARHVGVFKPLIMTSVYNRLASACQARKIITRNAIHSY